MNEKLMEVIKNTYANVRSRVIVNDKLSDWFDIGIGLRQGCVLSPLLFLIFINDLVRELNDSNLGVAIGNGKLSNLTFADDIALMANNSRDLQKLLIKDCRELCQKMELRVQHEEAQSPRVQPQRCPAHYHLR